MWLKHRTNLREEVVRDSRDRPATHHRHFAPGHCHDRTHDVFETVFAVRSTGPMLRETISQMTEDTETGH
jgi:hypothetical protein